MVVSDRLGHLAEVLGVGEQHDLARLRDGRVELRRSGGVWGYGEGSATGTICGWELDSARSRDWSLVHYSQYRTDTTYAEVRP